MKSSWIVLFALLLGISFAPMVLAQPSEKCEMCKGMHEEGMSMDKKDMGMHRPDPNMIMEAIMRLKYHPKGIKELSAEKIMWLLDGIKHMSRIPFVDQDALFDLQLKITLHLLDLQVKRLHTISPYKPYKAPSYYGYGDYGKKEHYEEVRYPVAQKYQPVVLIKKGKLHMPYSLITKVHQFDFYSSKGCQLNQGKIARQNALNRDIFVGPCQGGEGQWSFNVWKV